MICDEFKSTRKNGAQSDNFKEHILKEREKFEARKASDIENYNIDPSLCPKCGNPKSYEKRNNKFCSRSCANGRVHSEETKNKIRVGVKLNPSGVAVMSKEELIKCNISKKIPRIVKKCKTCDEDFEIKITESKDYCSIKCNPHHGGYRKGSGRAYGGYYKGIYCHSTYELVWVMYNIHNNIPFEKFVGFLGYSYQNEAKKYIPDFIQDNTIIEIKGYYTDLVEIKKNAAINQGYNIKVLYKNDLKYCFDWFRETFPNKKLKEMFDDYKPKYSYICDNCNIQFETDVKRKTSVKFCSRKCAGESRTRTNIMEGRTGNAPASLP